jgi:putative addiction module component (TIGR02574 family)
MNIPIEKLTEAALSLPSDARALLADRLAESLDPLEDPAVRDLWASEALRRLDEVRSGAVKAVPEEAVRQRIQALLKK